MIQVRSLFPLACIAILSHAQAQHHSHAIKAGVPVSVVDAGIIDALPTQNIADILRSQAGMVPRLNQVLQTEQNQRLLERLESETKPKIVFLPSSTVLNGIPQEQFDSLVNDPVAAEQFVLQHIVDDKYGIQWGMMYHLHNQQVANENPLPGEQSEDEIDTTWLPGVGALPTLGGMGVNFELSVDYSKIQINGMNLSGDYEVATNGTVFELNGVLSPPTLSLTEKILQNPELSIFYQILALQSVDSEEIAFSQLFPGIGNATVYAVKDSGFTEEQKESLLAPENAEMRMGFLRSQTAQGFYATNHFFNYHFQTSPYGWDTGFTNLNQQPVRVREDVDPEVSTAPETAPRLSYGEWATQVPGGRGCTVTTPDTVCTDGLLQVMDFPFLLPGAGIQDIFALVPDLAEENYFVNTYHNRGHTFNEGGPYTYFAAVNEGYRSKTNEEINAQYFTPAGFLERFAYAKVPGCFYLNQLTDAEYESSDGNKIKASEDENGYVWLNDKSRVLTGNIACNNGLIHIVDTPLDPPGDWNVEIEDGSELSEALKSSGHTTKSIDETLAQSNVSEATILISKDGNGVEKTAGIMIGVEHLPQDALTKIDQVFGSVASSEKTFKVVTKAGNLRLEIYSNGVFQGVYSYKDAKVYDGRCVSYIIEVRAIQP